MSFPNTPRPFFYLIGKLDRLYRKLVYYKYFNTSYLTRIYHGDVERPHYGLNIYQAAELAHALGYEKISAIEFGVAGGNGLVSIENHVEKIKREIPVDIEVYGFDSSEGLPPTKDYRDIMYNWNEGAFVMDYEKLKSKLRFAKLIIGDVAQTVTEFFEKYNPAPIGFISFDLDYYTSTKNALAIFNGKDRNYLPRVNCYFDDVNLTNHHIGELCAIEEFNRENESKKIALKYNFGQRIYDQYSPWLMLGNRMFEYHNFKHPFYNKLVGDARERSLELV